MEIRTTIVGTKYRGVEAIAKLGSLEKGDSLVLKREKGHEKDDNAVAVYKDGMHLGYIPMTDNKPVADLLDAGIDLIAEVSLTTIIHNNAVRYLGKIIVKDESE